MKSMIMLILALNVSSALAQCVDATSRVELNSVSGIGDYLRNIYYGKEVSLKKVINQCSTSLNFNYGDLCSLTKDQPADEKDEFYTKRSSTSVKIDDYPSFKLGHREFYSRMDESNKVYSSACLVNDKYACDKVLLSNQGLVCFSFKNQANEQLILSYEKLEPVNSAAIGNCGFSERTIVRKHKPLITALGVGISAGNSKLPEVLEENQLNYFDCKVNVENRKEESFTSIMNNDLLAQTGKYACYVTGGDIQTLGRDGEKCEEIAFFQDHLICTSDGVKKEIKYSKDCQSKDLVFSGETTINNRSRRQTNMDSTEENSQPTRASAR
jgi:hypothetical protein